MTKEELLWMRLQHIHDRVQAIANAEAKAAWIRGAAADGRSSRKKNDSWTRQSISWTNWKNVCCRDCQRLSPPTRGRVRRFLTMPTPRITHGPRPGQAQAFQSRISVFKLLALGAPPGLLARFIRERNQ
jgi:hypothetical protein